MKNKTPLKNILYSLIIIYIILFAYIMFVFPLLNSYSSLHFLRSILFLPLMVILGTALIVQGIRLTLRARKKSGILKVFLLITGLSAIAPMPFTILHNLFYGLAETFENLKSIFEVLHGTSFIISVLIAPVLFIIGIVGSIIILKRMTGKKEE